MIQAGKLRSRITIEAPTEAADAYGAVERTWSTHCQAWASIESPSGREAMQSGSPQAFLSHLVRMRYRTGITPKMRIKWGDRILNIGSVADPNQRHEELLLACTEVL